MIVFFSKKSSETVGKVFKADSPSGHKFWAARGRPQRSLRSPSQSLADPRRHGRMTVFMSHIFERSPADTLTLNVRIGLQFSKDLKCFEAG